MLMRDFGFTIYKAIANSPKLKEDKKKDDKKEDRREKEEKKEEKKNDVCDFLNLFSIFLRRTDSLIDR